MGRRGGEGECRRGGVPTWTTRRLGRLRRRGRDVTRDHDRLVGDGRTAWDPGGWGRRDSGYEVPLLGVRVGPTRALSEEGEYGWGVSRAGKLQETYL